MMNNFSCSIPKIIDTSQNEDAILAIENRIAISDGAGGYGIFAKEWSQYLLNKLPHQPFKKFQFFSDWTNSIWEDFYNERIKNMPYYDKFVENKFNKEGSCATLVGVWIEESLCHWCAYGDSSLFVINKNSGEVRFMSNPELLIYDKNPFLLNWKDFPKEQAYMQGTINLQEQDCVLIASDALSCFITMAYYAYTNDEQIEICTQKITKLNNLVINIKMYVQDIKKRQPINFYQDIIQQLCTNNEKDFKHHIELLFRYGVIMNDDYSIAGLEI